MRPLSGRWQEQLSGVEGSRVRNTGRDAPMEGPRHCLSGVLCSCSGALMSLGFHRFGWPAPAPHSLAFGAVRCSCGPCLALSVFGFVHDPLCTVWIYTPPAPQSAHAHSSWRGQWGQRTKCPRRPTLPCTHSADLTLQQEACGLWPAQQPWCRFGLRKGPLFLICSTFP